MPRQTVLGKDGGQGEDLNGGKGDEQPGRRVKWF